jgi:hypothetical protein
MADSGISAGGGLPFQLPPGVQFPTVTYDPGGQWSEGSGGQWTPGSGSDLPGGGDTGQPAGSNSSINVGPGQIPSSVYNQLVSSGLIPQGATDATANSALQQVMSALGLSGAGGMSSLIPLLSLLGPAAGGILGYLRSGQATQQVQAGIKNAQGAVSNILGQNSPYSAYLNVGPTALKNLQGMNWNPIQMAALGSTSGPAAGATPVAGAFPQASLSSLMRRGR